MNISAAESQSTGVSLRTLLYSAMHFLVDFLCAWGMYAFFGRSGNRNHQMLVYNFCAFALQLPLGTALDVAVAYAKGQWKYYLPRIWAAMGVMATLAGVFTQTWLLGLGNALFHVGGGMDVIQEDFSRRRRGQLLGVFVSPGAIGLYLGGILGRNPQGKDFLLAAAVLICLTVFLFIGKGSIPECRASQPENTEKAAVWLAACCFAVVILRSATGFYVNFPWKAEPILGWLTVLAVASGKLTGGFLAARYGAMRTVFVSLLLCAGCFLLGHWWGFGIAALFLFNMSMPITLYLLAGKMTNAPGFSFGLLTFGLFLGFLPVYWGLVFPVGPAVVGTLGSLVSLSIFLLCRRVMEL